MEKHINNLSIDFILKLFGTLDGNIDLLENELSVRISNGEDGIKITGESAENLEITANVIRQLERISALNDVIDENSINYVISMIKDNKASDLSAMLNDCICLTNKGKPIKAKTVGQQQYVDNIKTNTICFGVGPAGTGKTFLAVAMAVTALKQKQISRIILTRPAVEAGEKLGFLPGDLQSKIDPYLRPLYDALGEMLGGESFAKHIEKNTIEIAPLAYMRGRTLDDAFIILDEAQNTTPEQMKMFLTRLGNNSKAIVTGDVTQIDLPFIRKSGLVEAIEILDNIKGISIFHFTHRDVVRHPLVQKIILAYEKNNTKQLQTQAKQEKSTLYTKNKIYKRK
ncbi:PhoH family protein [Eubacteriales bacterium OttesenSCG-928-G02]|nr:PhoH family protein [Eubacteriales bacterium OttesenSCG-928-G02]